MKIRLDITLDIDAEMWQAEYGCEDVRQDIKELVRNILWNLEVMPNGVMVR